MTARPPLALILVSADAARLRAALVLARSEVALGGIARMFVQGEAVSLLKRPMAVAQDDAWRAAGEPTLAALLDEALEDGVAISLCQSSLAMAGMVAGDLDPDIVLTGTIAFLAAAGPDVRLLTL
jgi:predicted peroxiredoxin